MFVQFVKAKVSDVAGAKAAVARWERDLRPEAVGFLGSTGGLNAAGEWVTVARFESASAAAANGARPEQDAWWQEMVACVDGEPALKETENVVVLFENGCDDAGFVQILEGSGEEAALRDLDQRFLAFAAELRPDLLGGYRAFFADGTFADVAYFTSEADARAAESQAMPPEVEALIAELGSTVTDMTYHDIAEPIIL